jgi:thymidine kinase
MFSGKTEAAQAEARKAKIAKRKIVYFRPWAANRKDATCVVSHAGNTIEGLTPVLLGEGEEHKVFEIGREYDVIIVDEVQWLKTTAAKHLSQLYYLGKVVIVCGLDSDYLGKPFETLLAVRAIPEAECHALVAICSECFSPNATRTQRMSAGAPVTEETVRYEVGGEEKYRAVCIECAMHTGTVNP